MTKEQLEKIAKYNQKLEKNLKQQRKAACFYTSISALTGFFSVEFLISAILESGKLDGKLIGYSMIMSIMLSGTTGLSVYAAKNSFTNISDLKRRYIDSERYELEEELKNENSQENVKRL